ncbi:MAG: hypothetical protein WBM77_08200 [Maribacter sp.]
MIGKIAPNVYVIPRIKPSRYSGRNNGTKKDAIISAIIIKPGTSEPIVKKNDTTIPNKRAPKNRYTKGIEVDLIFDSSMAYILFLMRYNKNHVSNGRIIAPHQFDIPGKSARCRI